LPCKADAEALHYFLPLSIVTLFKSVLKDPVTPLMTNDTELAVATRLLLKAGSLSANLFPIERKESRITTHK
jgi:hypothetical protein